MDEFPRYRKASTRRPPRKSNHKHLYKYCVFHEHYKNHESFRIGTYCPDCGKIGYGGITDLEEDGWMDDLSYGPWAAHEWSCRAKREFDPDTRTLPCFEISDFRQKFVDMSQERSTKEDG